jgi:hypothetical protein
MKISNIKPGFLNYEHDQSGKPCGYILEKDYEQFCPFSWGPWTKSIWYFELNILRPLIFVCENGQYIKPSATKFDTDFGSIPIPLRSLPNCNESRFLLSYIFHDNIYNAHWIWVSTDQGNTWIHKDMTREEADNQLKECILNEPQAGSSFIANLIWSQVRLWGNSAWIRSNKYIINKSSINK